MGLLDAWRKFHQSGTGLGLSFKLDANLKPVSVGPISIERKPDVEKGDIDASFTETDPLKRFKTSDWKNLSIDRWEPHTFWCYWAAKYLEHTKFPYGARSAKESMLIKKLVSEYGNEFIKKTIDYVLEKHKTLKYLDGSRPSIAFLYGFRRTLVPEAVEGRVSTELTDVEKGPEDVNSW